jgi:hypothetical protein
VARSLRVYTCCVYLLRIVAVYTCRPLAAGVSKQATCKAVLLSMSGELREDLVKPRRCGRRGSRGLQRRRGTSVCEAAVDCDDVGLF